MKTLGIVFLCILAAVFYGILHDQITARICVEYFTIGHPIVFGTEDPTLLGIGGGFWPPGGWACYWEWARLCARHGPGPNGPLPVWCGRSCSAGDHGWLCGHGGRGGSFCRFAASGTLSERLLRPCRHTSMWHF